MANKEETVKISGAGGAATLPELLYVSPSPHIRKLDTVRSIMFDVILALMPALCWGVYYFGLRALWIVLISVASAVICEAAYCALAHRTVRITDLSAVVTGLMLGLMMPSGVALWVPAVGSAFAIIVVKQFFGGLGSNIVNPAIAARVFLMLCWPEQMVKYVNKAGDLVSSATALVQMKEGNTPSISLFNLVIGNTPGAIGEVSAIALGAGFVYLLFRRIVSWRIPVAFMSVIILVSIFAPATGETTAFYYQILSGGFLFAALFSANDPTTTPVTRWGQFIFGLGCGGVTVLIRYFGAYPDGTAYAILIMNLLVPIFEMWTKPCKFGGKNEKAQ